MRFRNSGSLFCTPPYHLYNLADEKVYVVESLQVDVLSSLLDKQHFDVQCLDSRLHRRRGSLQRKLATFQPHVLGTTSWTMHADLTKEAFRVANAYDPTNVTMVGGEHTRITLWDFAAPETAFIVMGEGYRSFSILMNSLRDGSDGYRDLDGVAFQQDGVFYSNGQAVVPKQFDLDQLPFPDRQITAPFRPERSLSSLAVRVM
jgi:hopanoid C-3 methylase